MLGPTDRFLADPANGLIIGLPLGDRTKHLSVVCDVMY